MRDLKNLLKTNQIALKLALISLMRNKRRTALSLLGVVIGVMLVIVVLSLGAGMKEYVMDQIESFGTDIIEVEVKVPGTAKTSSSNAGGIATGTEIKTLTMNDAEDLAKLDNLGVWYAGIITQKLASYKKENKSVMIMGTTPGMFEIDRNTKVTKGSFFTEKESDSAAKVVLLGSELTKDLFGNENAVGKKIKIDTQKYIVKGVLEERGSSGFFDFDNIVYMPTPTVQKKLLNIDHIQWIIFKSKDTSKDSLTIKAMEKILQDNHDIDKEIDEDFAITSMSEASEIVGDVFNILNYLLIGITSISLIVGGVGIMNVMYVAVTERTFEIGLRKAIGARKKDILLQFIYEAIILTMLGGFIGIVLGLLIAKIAELIAGKLDFVLNFPVTLFSVVLAVGFSAITGVSFGFKPAQKASKMTPMEALRND